MALFEGFRNNGVVQVACNNKGQWFARVKGTRQWLQTNDVKVIEEGRVIDYRLTMCHLVEGKKPNLNASVERKEKVPKALSNGEVQVVCMPCGKWYSRAKGGRKWGSWAEDDHPLAYRGLKKVSINLEDVVL